MSIRKQRRLLKTEIDQGDDSSVVRIKEEQQRTPTRHLLQQVTTETGTSTRAVTPAVPSREPPAIPQ